MSTHLTFRQKLIRVTASSALCGLTFSFLIGETVDYQAKQLGSWVVAPRLVPADYLPLRPAQLAMAAALDPAAIELGLVAANSNNAASPTLSPTLTTFQDTVRMALAAPDRAPDPILKEEPMENAEVERLLHSIHSATATLSQGARGSERAAMANDASINTFSLVKEEAPAGRVGDIVIENGEVVPHAGPNSPMPPPGIPIRPMVRPAVESAMAGNGNWQLKGRFRAPAALPPGHFEVGLFQKIDPEGLPVGYPIVQEILPAGARDFSLQVPAKVSSGYLYGEFVAAKGGKRSWIAPPVNPWLRGDRQVAELDFQPEARDAVATVSSASVRSETTRVEGTVTTAFVKSGAPAIPQEDVLIKVRGRKESARTDKTGAFRLELPPLKGEVFLEFLKPGYHPVVVPIPVSADALNLKLEMASRDAVDQLARFVGLRQLSTKGVFIGKALGADGLPLKNFTLRTTLKAEGPFYFGEEGHISADRRATSSDGRFVFFNLEPGVGFVESNAGGEPVVPFVLSTVEGGEMVVKTLSVASGSLRGRLFNPVSAKGKLAPLSGARVRIEGDSDWAVTDAYGAFAIGPLRWMRGERISLEASAEKFSNHHYSLIPGQSKAALNLFAFPAAYVSQLARSMEIDIDSTAGMVMGKVSGPPVRIDALAEHSVVNGSKDFYFDSMGRLRGSHTMTDPRFGTYMIFNVPKGRVLLQGSDATGTLRYSDAVVTQPASISIVME